MNGANGTDCSGVVEAEDGGEVVGAAKKFADWRVAEVGGPGVFLQIDAELGPDGDANLLRDAGDRFPTDFGVADEAGTFHEGDTPVAEIVEVTQGDFGG